MLNAATLDQTDLFGFRNKNDDPSSEIKRFYL